jgi:hypothetical protein
MATMKTYISAFFMTIAGACLAWVLLFYSVLGAPVSKSQWIHDAYRIKDAAVFSITAPKVVLVSGSNIMFGVNSESLSAFWGKPVVNYGVHAGLGLAYNLERSKRVLTAGDIAILPLEYEFFQEQNDYTETLLVQMASNDPDYYYALPLYEKLRVMGKMPWKRMRRGLQSVFRKESRQGSAGMDSDQDAGTYSVVNINAHGDQINLEAENMDARERQRLARLKAVKLDNSVVSEYAREILNDYLGWARANDVCLIVMPSSHVYFDEYRGPVYTEFLHNIKNYFYESGVPYIGDPYSYMYQKSYHFGDRYHLNNLGIEKRTARIMQDTGNAVDALCESWQPAGTE